MPRLEMGLVGMINQFWYAVPLVVVISLVYSATRHELMRPILIQSVRLGMWIAGFMAAIFAGASGRRLVAVGPFPLLKPPQFRPAVPRFGRLRRASLRSAFCRPRIRWALCSVPAGHSRERLDASVRPVGRL